MLDIGAGVGAVHLELLKAGASSATDVDGSPAYVAAAREEAARQGVAERIDYRVGDFVELAETIEPADLVVLDRVICCYPDMRSLVGLSAAHARMRVGLVYPRDTWWARLGGAIVNGGCRVARRRLRFYVHRSADVEEVLRTAGFVSAGRRTGLFWQSVVLKRT